VIRAKICSRKFVDAEEHFAKQ